MPSFNNPKVTNPINSDVSEIRELLQILAKQDYTGVDDTPTGAKRITTVTGGMQLQQFSSDTWSSIGKLMHDVDKLDGHHASTTAAKGTIPVYNSSALLPGGITGNAATATKLASKKTIDIGGIASADAVGFDGSGNITIPINSINVANDDDNALVGIVSKAHGGTGRNDGAATDVIVSSLAGDVKASDYGQIGYAASASNKDLNTLTVNGHYLANSGCTVENNYPDDMFGTIHIDVLTRGTLIIQHLWSAYTMWRRGSNDSGASWTGWQCISSVNSGAKKIYISKSGSDTNTGLESSYPVYTFDRALAIAKNLYPNNSSNNSPWVMFCVGSGDWGSVAFQSIPYKFYIRPFDGNVTSGYSDSLPSFSSISCENGYGTLQGVVSSSVTANHNGIILISNYNRIEAFAGQFGGLVFVDFSAVIDIVSGSSHRSVIGAYRKGQTFVDPGASINITENLSVSSGFIATDHSSCLYVEKKSIKVSSGVTVTGKKYYISTKSLVNGISLMDLNTLPGTTNGIISTGCSINNTPYGGGASDEALMADLSWKPVLLLSGGTMTGTINSESTDIVLQHKSSTVSISDSSRSSTTSVLLCTDLDKNGNRGGGIELSYNQEGGRNLHFTMRSRDNSRWLSSFGLVEKVDGSVYINGYTPSDSASGTEVITAAWANKNIGSKLAGYLPLTGGTITGQLKFNLSETDDYIADIVALNDSNGKRLVIDTYEIGDYGAFIELRKGSDTLNPGGFVVGARVKDGSSAVVLSGLTNGQLVWGGKNIVRSVNGVDADANGNVTLSSITATGLKCASAEYIIAKNTHNLKPIFHIKAPSYGYKWLVVGNAQARYWTAGKKWAYVNVEITPTLYAPGAMISNIEAENVTIDTSRTSWTVKELMCMSVSF